MCISLYLVLHETGRPVQTLAGQAPGIDPLKRERAAIEHAVAQWASVCVDEITKGYNAMLRGDEVVSEPAPPHLVAFASEPELEPGGCGTTKAVHQKASKLWPFSENGYIKPLHKGDDIAGFEVVKYSPVCSYCRITSTV